jgi:hypothetical protein
VTHGGVRVIEVQILGLNIGYPLGIGTLAGISNLGRVRLARRFLLSLSEEVAFDSLVIEVDYGSAKYSFSVLASSTKAQSSPNLDEARRLTYVAVNAQQKGNKPRSHGHLKE